MPTLNKKILLRVTERERLAIQTQAKLNNLSVNDFLRHVALKLPTESQIDAERRLAALEERVAQLEESCPSPS